jgi:hypothetical protein
MSETFVENSLLLSLYTLDMNNTDFPTFPTQYILDFPSASRRKTIGFAKHSDFPV